MRRINRKIMFSAVAGLMLMPASAFAHLVNANVKGFYAGMLHPLTAADHFLPVLALSILAGRQGKRAGRITVVLFPLSLLIGILLGSVFSLPIVLRAANIAVLIVLGILIIASGRLTLQFAVAGAVAAGLILGWRTGMDWGASNVGFQFVPGVVLTGFMLTAVIVAWLPRTLDRREILFQTVGGIGILAAGILFLTQFLSGGEMVFDRSIGLPSEESLKALVAAPELSLTFVIGACFAAMAWGAAHALTPGHGKAIVAAYLVGARSSPIFALYLGLTVTVTHTLVVFILGGTAVFASNFIDPDTLNPLLASVSGFILFILGIVMLTNRMRRSTPAHHGHKRKNQLIHHHEHHAHHHDHPGHHHEDHAHPHPPYGFHDHSQEHHHDAENPHDHDPHHTRDARPAHERVEHDPLSHTHGGHSHSHLPPGADGAPVTWRSLLALGIGAGMLPCPSAMVLLLTAVALQRIGFGLVLVAAFSVGLAGVLTMVGLLFIKGSRIIHEVRRPFFLKALSWAPALGALVICLLGGGIIWDSVSKMIG